mmetsp:Transcript_28754/g.46166  ORF Transcript_28754/g.46166 Transcript_28754/m.46166 type:complete len:91 (+) Transcript_28754:164-436(+)
MSVAHSFHSSTLYPQHSYQITQYIFAGIACEAEPDSHEECTRAVGQCGHSFHYHCISKWLQSRATCPLDDTNWEYAKYESQGKSDSTPST